MKKIYIEITNICNLNCSFCPKNEREKKYMDINQFDLILNKIKGRTKYINLHVMGEPLMHPNLGLILKKAYEKDYLVNLTTNGRLLEKNLGIINDAEAIRQINISLHSFELLDEQKKIIDLIDKINKNKYVSIRLWSNKDNSRIIQYIEDKYNIKIENDGFKISDNIYLNQDIEFEWPNIDRDIIQEKGTCYGLRDHIGILVDGTVVPCCLDYCGYNNLGNIYNDSLDNILNDEKAVSMKKGFAEGKLVNELCKRCGYINRFRKE